LFFFSFFLLKKKKRKKQEPGLKPQALQVRRRRAIHDTTRTHDAQRIRAEPEQGAAQSAERLGVARQCGNVVLQQW